MSAQRFRNLFIERVVAKDIRFPTSKQLDGSDAVVRHALVNLNSSQIFSTKTPTTPARTSLSHSKTTKCKATASRSLVVEALKSVSSYCNYMPKC